MQAKRTAFANTGAGMTYLFCVSCEVNTAGKSLRYMSQKAYHYHCPYHNRYFSLLLPAPLPLS